MILSSKHYFEFRGELANMRVVRNNANCWVEVQAPSGCWVEVQAPSGRFAIQTDDDWYDECDEDIFKMAAVAGHDDKYVNKSMLT